MKHELEHFQIGDSYGGNQDWFPTLTMRGGGCAAQTACDASVYFAVHKGLTDIGPENASHLTKRDYIRFAYVMKPYLYPRRFGVNRLDIFIDGYAKFLQSRGETRLKMSPFYGSSSSEAARAAIIRQIDLGYPIPTLVLRHTNKKMEDYVWHWFLLNGYHRDGTDFLVKAVTYGEYEWLDLWELWDTGHEQRGGLVLFHMD